MALSINTNEGALSALQTLDRTNQLLQVSQARVNTGQKVSSSKDNAAIFSIAQSMRSDITGLNSVKQSLNRATSELDIAIAAAGTVSDLLVEMKEIAVAAKDTGLDDASRTTLNNDYQVYLKQINSIVGNAELNGVNLLNSSTLSAITDANGTGANNLTATFNALTLSALGLEGTTLTGSGSAGSSGLPADNYSISSSNSYFSEGTGGDDGNEALIAYINDNFSDLTSFVESDPINGDPAFTSASELTTVTKQLSTDTGASVKSGGFVKDGNTTYRYPIIKSGTVSFGNDGTGW